MAQYTSHDGSHVYICNNKRTVGNGVYVQYAMVDASLCNRQLQEKMFSVGSTSRLYLLN
jgi:hypothetical protein